MSDSGTAEPARGGGSTRPAARDRRELVLRELRAAGTPLGVADLAERLGVHPNTVRFHLDKLSESGRVEQVPVQVRSTGRPPQLFRPVRSMDPTGPRQFRVLAEVLVAALAENDDPGESAAAAGRAWGRARAVEQGEPRPPGARADRPVDRLVDLLDGLGFGPELSAGVGRGTGGRADGAADWIGLRRCPFLELATTRPGVVCPVHLGLMQGALEEWDAEVSVDRLDPFVQPDLCLAHLAPRSA